MKLLPIILLLAVLAWCVLSPSEPKEDQPLTEAELKQDALQSGDDLQHWRWNMPCVAPTGTSTGHLDKP